MTRITGAVFTVAILATGLLLPSTTPAHATPPDLCQYQLGSKIVTIACGEDPQAEPGMAGNMPGRLGPDSAIGRFEQEDQQQQQEVLQGQYQDGWYPGCVTTPMC